MAVVSMKHLLEAGVHFGHQTRRWNPKMKPFIFTERNGIYILDLQKTLRLIEAAYDFVRDSVEAGGTILFVGTKKQAQEALEEEATRCGMPYVNFRWLGGMLTNFDTMKRRIAKLDELDRMSEDGSMAALPKKEAQKLEALRQKLTRNLGGIRTLKGLPCAVFIVDPRKERIAVAEARRSEVPIVAIVDTNCDPDEVDWIISGNDDAIRSVTLITRIIADAVIEGQERRAAKMAEMAAAQAEKEAVATEGESTPEASEAKPGSGTATGESATARA